MKITIEYNVEEDNISAFAYNIGVMIEKIISERTNDLNKQNKLLEAKILDFFNQTTDSKYMQYFGIQAQNKGKL